MVPLTIRREADTIYARIYLSSQEVHPEIEQEVRA